MLFAFFSSFCLQSNIVSFILQVLSFRREGEETMEKTCIGIDIGGTSVKLGLFKAAGELL